MEVVEWIVWGLACAYTVIVFLLFLAFLFGFAGDPFEDWLPATLKVLPLKLMICSVYVAGMATGVVITAIWNVSKLHLLWFIPIFHYFSKPGVAWIFILWSKHKYKEH